MITLANFKKYLKIDSGDSTKDDQLNLAISNAKGFLEAYLGYSLELDASRVATFIGEYAHEFELPFVNINSISTIKYGEDEFDSSLTSYTGDSRTYLERGLVKTRENIGPYVEITYSFGYDENTCPEGLKVVLYEIASMQYKSMGEVSTGDVKSESVDGDQIVFKDFVGQLSPNSLALLDDYKQYDFSS